MLNERDMLMAFFAKCEKVVNECQECHSPSDVQDAYADFCEAQGMANLLEAGWGKPLFIANSVAQYWISAAWESWNKASSRVCYDTATGERLAGC